MFALEMKILVLTVVYFIGWFLFEKAALSVWERWSEGIVNAPKTNRVHIPALSTVTPLDQTSRYIKGLKNTDWRVRRISCIQLGEKRGSLVVHALVEALNDPREEVSIAAGEALVKIGDPSAIAQLTAHVQRLDEKMEDSLDRLRAA